MRLLIEIADEWAPAVRRSGPGVRLEIGGLFGWAINGRIIQVIAPADPADDVPAVT